MTDLLIVLILVVLGIFALRSVLKRKGRCSCGCDSCPYSKDCGDKKSANDV